MKICAISDVHVTGAGPLPKNTPEADVLTISGDLTMNGMVGELVRFREWLVRQPQKHKVVIAGNHDFCFEDNNRIVAETVVGGDGIIYLMDQSTTIDNIKFYGSPWQPWFYDWAFNLSRGPVIAEKWALIPTDVDVLLTHGPPQGFGDKTTGQDRVGCRDLLKAIEDKSPRVVCYGHIHEDTGVWTHNKSVLVNCSVGYQISPDDVASREPFMYEITKDQLKY